ncbi:FMN-dependent NADH-azoreductase [Methylosinus sp. LW4]|uniref:FMN-dependent NADH-azoreductase n=1 Tax=Methylosinus sp. LW4 TaxID=136993 RepID=UPI0003A5CE37|nr:NAD(P)H-dependent oxidoreductase [Methylosinus sp. LW4]
MATLLHLDASVRGGRSLSRQLSRSFIDVWSEQHPADAVLRRDLSEHAPPFVDEAWIAACFTKPEARTPAMHAVLAVSDELISELEVADVLVIGTPMFNYGMPAILKAWVDQVVRVDRTFSFDLARGDWPLEPILSGKALVILTSSGEFGFGPGGEREEMNHLDTHLRVVGRYLGATKAFHIGIEYQEFGDDRHSRSLADALAAVQPLVRQVSEFIATRPLSTTSR